MGELQGIMVQVLKINVLIPDDRDVDEYPE